MKRLLAGILCICLLMTMLPMAASASVGGVAPPSSGGTSSEGSVSGGDETTGGETTGGETTGGDETTGEDDTEPTVPNGHTQLSVVDSELLYGGNYRYIRGESSLAGDYSVSWTKPGVAVVYSDVSIENAKYIEVCTALVIDDATEDGSIGIYLDDETEPVATVGCDLGETFHIETAALSKTVSGNHTVTLKVLASKPDIAWIRFLSEEEADFIYGHERMMVTDATECAGGDFAYIDVDNKFVPAYRGWFGTGSWIRYDNVLLNEVSYLELCVGFHQQTNRIEIYLDNGTTPIAAIDSGYLGTLHVETMALEEPVSGEHTVTIRSKAGEAHVSWIRFKSEAEYNDKPKEIALMGDSNVEIGNYYYALAGMVDQDEYLVKNYGVSGATAESYLNTEKYQNAIAAKADIYVITLGSNDLNFSETYLSTTFYEKYMTIVNAIWEANPEAKIYAQTTTPLRHADNPWGVNVIENRTEKKIVEYIIPVLERICEETDVEIVRVYEALTGSGFTRDHLIYDDVHLNYSGGKIMAKATYDVIFPEADLGEGTAPGTVDAVTVTVPKTELTKKGETVTLSANTEVYWKVQAVGGGSTTFATIDENGVLTAQKAGAYEVVATAKADTAVTETVRFYNRFPFTAGELDFVLGHYYGKNMSADPRDGGVKVGGLQDGLTFYMKDVDLSGMTTATARGFSTSSNAAVDSTVTFHLDAADGPMLAKCTITDSRLKTNEGWPQRYADYTGDMIPVTDGELHDVYAVVHLPNPGKFNFDVLSFDFGTLDDNRTIVVKDGEVMDTYSKNFTWKKGEYTLLSLSEDTPVSAFFDEEGNLLDTALYTKEGGVQQASLTLSEDVPAGTLRTYQWNSLSGMQPVTPASRTYQKPVTIGCVGDSITRELNGTATDDSRLLSYPKFLQLALGNRFEVKNFGRGATTAGSYYDVDDYDNAVAAACDIYVIQFGTNDSKSDSDTASFKENYQRLIDGFKAANPDCEIYLCLPFPAYENPYDIRPAVQKDTIIPAVRELANENGAKVIDLYTPVDDEIKSGRSISEFYVSDQIHPTEYGMVYLAELVKSGLFTE